ncbi:hypothetical protein MFUL124B02_36420 [Myxococcus fulvus 124B02]|nr:hypothetical protein MFUL124B02_36420 [Myxococcus fulvus 124B02]
MLNALQLENFKGFAERQRIEFSPLTLLFGANNAGKSTVIQSLLFLHEVLERGSPDVDRTELGGAVLELGGLARLVHRHDLDRTLAVRAEFSTTGELNWMGRDLEGTGTLLAELDDALRTAWVEVSATHRLTSRRHEAVVDKLTVGSGEAPLVTVEVSPKLREGEPLLMRVHLGHPLLAPQSERLMASWEDFAVPERVSASAKAADLSLLFAISSSRPSAVPLLSEPIQLVGVAGAASAAFVEIQTFLEMAVTGVLRQLVNELRGALYVGPLRSIPPRGFLYEKTGRLSSWADGLAAWDVLLSDRAGLVDRTNAWLDRIDAGCEIAAQSLFEAQATAEAISEEHADSTVRRLLLRVSGGTPVLPSEVGAGISQVVPVVVASVYGRPPLFIAEQPELHVHPSMQTGLGDVLVDAATREQGRRAVVVETHSEHLILRLLRRIRETSSGELPQEAPSLRPSDLSVLWVEATDAGTTVRRLRVSEAGEFIDAWPRGFFDERFQEVYGP